MIHLDNVWPYVWSLGLIIIGIYIITKRKIEVGILGRPPVFYLKGRSAIIIGLLAVLVGLFVLLNPDIIMKK